MGKHSKFTEALRRVCEDHGWENVNICVGGGEGFRLMQMSASQTIARVRGEVVDFPMIPDGESLFTWAMQDTVSGSATVIEFPASPAMLDHVKRRDG